MIGERILAPIEFLKPVLPLVRHAHERWDGAGYPDGLAGEEIPFGARILFVCDAHDAMSTDRPTERSLPRPRSGASCSRARAPSSTRPCRRAVRGPRPRLQATDLSARRRRTARQLRRTQPAISSEASERLPHRGHRLKLCGSTAPQWRHSGFGWTTEGTPRSVDTGRSISARPIGPARLCAMADEQASRPASGRVARTARLGRVAAGGRGALGGRPPRRARQRRRAAAPPRRPRGRDDRLARRPARGHARRGDEGRAGALDGRVPGPRPRPVRAPAAPPRLAARQRPARSAGRRCASVLAGEWGSEPERCSRASRPEPAAAASIGQVYRGRSRDGREVAVKVQYPGIAEAVVSDMRNLRMLSPLLRRLMPGLEVKDVLAELAERITEECDYELEAANHRRLARFWRRHPFVSVPEVDTSLSRRRVLVTEWVDGIGFEQVAGRARAGPRPLRRDRLPLLLRHRRRARDRARRPASGQLPALPRRPGRLLRLRHGARAAARLPAPRGAGVRRDPRQRRRRAGRRDARARLPAGPVGRMGRRAAARAHARRRLVVHSATSRCAWRRRTSGAGPSRCARSRATRWSSRCAG